MAEFPFAGTTAHPVADIPWDPAEEGIHRQVAVEQHDCLNGVVILHVLVYHLDWAGHNEVWGFSCCAT